MWTIFVRELVEWISDYRRLSNARHCKKIAANLVNLRLNNHFLLCVNRRKSEQPIVIYLYMRI
jgi:hypothetical protein